MKIIQSGNILKAAIIIYVLYVIANLVMNTNEYFWDFKIYHYGVTCLEQHLNPYSIKDLSIVANRNWLLPFVYPPLTLHFFKLFNFENIKTATLVFLFFKLALLFCTIWIWTRILGNANDLLFYIFILLAFNSTVHIDLMTGNITIIIQFLLWTAFYFYLQKKYLLFCVFIVLASAFKLLPICFLLLLLFIGDKRKYIYFAGSSFAFALYLLLNYLLQPVLFPEFIKAAFGVLKESGIINPALFWFIKDMLHYLELRLRIQIPLVAGVAVFALFITGIVAVTYRAIKKINIKDSPLYKDREELLIFLFCFGYSFLMPRFKDYDYIFLIAPAYYLIVRIEFIKVKQLLVFVCAISSVSISLPGFKLLSSLLWNYYPLFLAFFIWFLYITYIKRSTAPVDRIATNTAYA